MTTSAQKDFTDHYGWDSALLDTDAYLDRLGYQGPTEPTVDTLRALTKAHSLTIPFENFDVLAGREIKLDVGSLFDKMVRRRRGGYCFEHNALFAAVLESVGFQVDGLGARLLNSRDDTILRSATHAALLVTVDDRRFVVDVGVGAGPEEPIELIDGNEVEVGPGWRYRTNFIDRDMWVLRTWTDGAWTSIHKFTLSPFYRADYVDANYIAQHHPRSPFHKTVTIGISKGDHHVDLLGNTLKRLYPDGSKTEETLEPNEVPEVVVKEFKIALTEEEKAEVSANASPIAHSDLMGDLSPRGDAAGGDVPALAGKEMTSYGNSRHA